MYLLDQLRDYECLPGHQDVKLVLCIQPECKERKRIICQQLCVPYYHKHHKTIEISSIQTFFDELIKLERPQLHVSVQESIDQIRILQREINHLIESIITKLVNHFGKFSLKAQKLAQEFQFKQTFDRLNQLYKDLPEVATFGDKIKIKLIKPLEPVSLDAALKECIQKLAGFSIGKHDEYSQKPEDKVNFFSSHCRIIQGDHEIWCLAVGKNGTIASGGDDRRVSLWDIETQQLLWQTKKHKKAITTIRFSSDYQTLVSGSQDGKFKIWNMITQELIKKIQAHDCQISYIDYGRNNSLLMTASWDKSIKIWNLKEKYESTSLIGHDDIVYVALFNSECSFVISCSLDTTIRFWDISSKPPQCEVMRGHSKRVDWITFSPNGKYLASCSSQERLFIIWDPITRQQLWQNKTGHDPYRIAFSPDSKLLATSHKDIRIYDMQSRLQVGDPIQGHKFWIWSLKFSHDGRYILTGCQDKTIKIFGLPKQ